MEREADWHLSPNSLMRSLARSSLGGVDWTTCRRSLAEVLASSMREASSCGGGRPRGLWGRAK